MGIFERLESEVRCYCRSFDTVFATARNETLTDEEGRTYIDFLAGAGSLNYGHNNPAIKTAIIEYLQKDGILNGLDLHTEAKREFLRTFDRHILWPREMDYKIQFTGPTGTNAVEAALKLARKVTGRMNVIAFTNGFHGVSLGSLAATGNRRFRASAGVPLEHVTFMPYDGYLAGADSLAYLSKALKDGSSGVDAPAAIIVETVQGEGGVNVASRDWLRGLEQVCRDSGVLLIVDDIQVGCGRTGRFFSFEEAGIAPAMITLSKSLGAYGLPMSVVLMKRELDQWSPGEHTGTFRGNNLAFVAATEAIKLYWRDEVLTHQIGAKGEMMHAALARLAARHPQMALKVRGRGMIWGISAEGHPELAGAVSRAAFERGVIVETSGANSQVLKLLPPLTITEDKLNQGLQIITESYEHVLAHSSMHAARELSSR